MCIRADTVCGRVAVPVSHCVCHGTCQLGPEPWRRQECGRKECGVTPSGRMECGVMPSGRRISLKGAVTHFFLSFFLFLPHTTTCFLVSLNKETTPFSPQPSCLPLPAARHPPAAVLVLSLRPADPSLRAALVLSSLRADPSLRTALVLSSLRADPSLRAALVLSLLRADPLCTLPSSSTRCAPSSRCHPCPVLAKYRPLAAVLVLPATGSPPDPAPLYFVASPPALPVAEPPNHPQNPSSWRKECPKSYHSRHRQSASKSPPTSTRSYASF